MPLNTSPNASLSTRADFESLLFCYLDPLLPHYSKGGALVRLAGSGAQYEDEVIPMEAWARPLWGLAPLWAGGGRSQDGVFEGLYARGLVAGTDPDSPEYWGVCRNHDQRFVEMAAIAYALLLAPGVLWEPLSFEEHGRVAAWLAQVNEYSFPAGNWLWFQALVNLALRERGCAFDEALLEEDLAALDGFYLGNGWYQDGPTGLPDYYNAMTFQFFGLLYARLFADADPERAARYRNRAALFAADYLRLFSARGEGLPYGRSMTYRFAQAGFWSMAAASGAELGEELSPAVLKGLVARNIAAWDRGRITDNGGVLTVGYHYPNQHMAEGYNAAGSPMWALMAFACLMLPEEDDFWAEQAAPLPELPALAPALGGSALVQRDAAGEVVLFPSGRVPGHPFAQSDNKYSKFAYSSRFGFSVARSQRTLEEAAPDSMLAFVINGRVFVRDGVEKSEVTRGADGGLRLVSRWSPWPGIEVETVIELLANGMGHVRRHRVVSSVACEVFDCGFAVPGDYHRMSLEEVELVCRVRAVGAAQGEPGEPVLIKPEPNTNISCGKTLIPAVSYQIVPGITQLATVVEVFSA